MIEEKDIVVSETRTQYIITCDNCGATLEEGTSCSDGWYPNEYEYEEKICTWNGWYIYHKDLCETCKKEIQSHLINCLTKFGFKKERG